MKNISFLFSAFISLCILFLMSTSLHAKVTAVSEEHFIIEHEVSVPLDAAKSYQLLGKPSQWWSSGHTWSGNAKNMSLTLKAGACFCETWNANSVMHAQVITAQPQSVLRLQGAFGPLQDMAVTAVLSFALKQEKNTTRVLMTYRVSGNASHKLPSIAPMVDAVLGEQLEGFRKAGSK